MKLRDPDLLRSRAFIGGKWVDAMSGATRQVLNPATREPIGARHSRHGPRTPPGSARRCCVAGTSC